MNSKKVVITMYGWGIRLFLITKLQPDEILPNMDISSIQRAIEEAFTCYKLKVIVKTLDNTSREYNFYCIAEPEIVPQQKEDADLLERTQGLSNILDNPCLFLFYVN